MRRPVSRQIKVGWRPENIEQHHVVEVGNLHGDNG